MGSLWDVARKEVEDSFSSRRFLLILLLFVLLSVASVYLGVRNYEQQMQMFLEGGSAYGSAPEEPSLMEVFEPLLTFNIALTAGLLGLLLSYDSIAKERAEETIELLLSYPIYRDEIINGKMVAGIFTVSFAILVSFILSSGLTIFLLDQIPSLEQISRLGFIWIGTTIYITFFLGLGTLLSTVFKSQWRALILGVGFLLAFIATPFIANIAAYQIYSMDDLDDQGNQEVMIEERRGEAVDVETMEQEQETDVEARRAEVQRQRDRFISVVSQMSPTVSFNSYTETMLGTEYESEDGLEPTFAESLGNSFDYLIYLISQTALVLALAYAVFLRQDL